MEYRVEFPIKFDCNLRCYYCFHSDYHNNRHPYTNGKRFERKFSLEQWEQWRDKFLADASEILIMFSGGEPFIPENAVLCRDFIERRDGVPYQYEFLTNGLFNKEEACFLCKHVSKIRRIGFTYHRKMIHDKPELIKKFYDNLLYIKNMSIPVYVKELLRVEDKGAILEHRRILSERYGVDLKIQDYKGDDRGLDCTEISEYSDCDCDLVDMEYRHEVGKLCACLSGYKDIKIRGYDEYSGNVIACWHDPVIIGNIQEMRFNPNFTVKILPDGAKRVEGVPREFAGTNTRDLPLINKKQRDSVMNNWAKNRTSELRNELRVADERIAGYTSELNKLQTVRLQIIGAIAVLDEQLKAEAQTQQDAAAQPESLLQEPDVSTKQSKATTAEKKTNAIQNLNQ